MAEYKRIWKNRFKSLRKKEGLTKSEFAEEILGMQNIKKYEAIESGKSAPSAYQKFMYQEALK